MQNLIHGVDVARYQSTIDWKLALSMGKRFCIAKASDGLRSSEDPMFDNHRAGSKAAGLIFGSYHFFRFDQDPIKQAENFLRITGGVLPGELPLTLDVEWDNQSKNERYHDGGRIDEGGALKALQCLWHLKEKTGMAPIIYTSNGFFSGLKKPDAFDEFIPWIAHYTTFEKIKVPAPWKRPVFWQYSDDERINGVQAIDGDAFLGTFEELQALTKPSEERLNYPGAPKPGITVNSQSIRDIQVAINSMYYEPALKMDGILGPKTRAALIEVAKNG